MKYRKHKGEEEISPKDFLALIREKAEFLEWIVH